MKVLIAGGAGYIGSTIASACIDAGVTPIIVDNLVNGRREFTEGRRFYEGDIGDREVLDRVFDDHPDIDAAIHCAALILVPESVLDPMAYYRANVAKSLEFVNYLIDHDCTRMIFSSTAAIYAPSASFSVNETSAIEPTSPYARTKAACEAMFEDIANASPMRILSLRYFNPIGADPKLRSGPQSTQPSHVLERMIKALRTGSRFAVTGADFETRDGTGIRDYIHVWDLARAHLESIERFESIFDDGSRYKVINLGTGVGTTVRELLDAFNHVVVTPLEVEVASRRPGDVAGAYANGELAECLIGWRPRLSIANAIQDALRWAEVRESLLRHHA
jgi:UDP-glucose 4-epimerase